MQKTIEKLFKKQGIRFLFVGGLNTLVGYGLYALFIFLNVNFFIANTLSTAIGILHSYLWNRFFTFKSKEKAGTEIVKFISVYIISYLISSVSLILLVNHLGINHYIAGLFNLIITTLISFFGHKYISFRKTNIVSKLKSKNKEDLLFKVEFITTIIIFILIFISFCYSDILITTNHSVSFIDLFLKNDLWNLYKQNYFTYTGFFKDTCITYDFPIFIPFALWNIPTYIYTKLISVNWQDSVLCMIWSKGILVFFLINSIILLNKIAGLFNIETTQKKYIKLLFMSSPIVMIAIAFFGGYDIISIFFTLLGIYYYIKDDNKKFVLFFSLAISLKLFALFIFIPLVLLREKNLLKDILYGIGGIAITVLAKLVYIKAPLYSESTSSFNSGMTDRLFANTIASPFGNISIFLLGFILVCIYAYVKNLNKNELKYYAMYISFLVYALFCQFVYIHPQWLILLVPYMIFITVANKKSFRNNLLIDFGISFGFSVIFSVVFYWVFCTGTMNKMMIHSIFNRAINYNGIGLYQTVGLSKYLPAFNAITCACFIAFAYLNHPNKWMNQDEIKINPPHDIIWIRLLSIIPFILIIILYYFK